MHVVTFQKNLCPLFKAVEQKSPFQRSHLKDEKFTLKVEVVARLAEYFATTLNP